MIRSRARAAATTLTESSTKATGRSCLQRQDNKKQGYGEFYFFKGDRYTGEFSSDKMSGKGALHLANNSQYCGRFRDGKKHGKGHFKDCNGVYFEEEWDMNAQISKKEISGVCNPRVVSPNETLVEYSHEPEEIVPSKLKEELHSLAQGSGSPVRKKPILMRNSKVGIETLSIQEFKENLGSFEDVFEDEIGRIAIKLVRKWNTDTVVKFMNHYGLNDYTDNFYNNQIVGDNLLKMTEEDMFELGIKAKGDILKFNHAISKLIKINETQNRRRKLNEKLIQIKKPKVQEHKRSNFIQWDSQMVDEPASQDNDMLQKVCLQDSGSAASKYNSRRTGSGVDSDNKKLGSIELTCPRIPSRKNSDIHLDLRSSNSVNESEHGPEPQVMTPLHHHAHNTLTHCHSQTFYNSSKPKRKRAHSMMDEIEEEPPYHTFIPVEPEAHVNKSKSESSKYALVTKDPRILLAPLQVSQQSRISTESLGTEDVGKGSTGADTVRAIRYRQ